MSLSTNNKADIWRTLANEKYPTLTEDQISALSLEAANLWYNGVDNELTELFDQYVMLKNLKGIEIDN